MLGSCGALPRYAPPLKLSTHWQTRPTSVVASVQRPWCAVWNSTIVALVAEAITLAALTRQESRGTHYLEEFPEKDDTYWLCNLLIHQGSDGVLQVRKTPVVTA